MLVSTRIRLGFTNVYSINEYKKECLLFYPIYFASYERMHSPTPSFTENFDFVAAYKYYTLKDFKNAFMILTTFNVSILLRFGKNKHQFVKKT